MGTLVAYGHSWVGGAGASQPARGFVELAARGLGLTADNRGVGGSHAPDTAELVSRAFPPAADHYLVMTGLNDARRHGLEDETIGAYEAALETIFTTLDRANPDARTITVAQPHLIDFSFHEPHNRGSNEALDAFNLRLRAVAARHPRVVVITVPDWDPTTMLDEDTIHPNDAGHVALARAVVSA